MLPASKGASAKRAGSGKLQVHGQTWPVYATSEQTQSVRGRVLGKASMAARGTGTQPACNSRWRPSQATPQRCPEMQHIAWKTGSRSQEYLRSTGRRTGCHTGSSSWGRRGTAGHNKQAGTPSHQYVERLVQCSLHRLVVTFKSYDRAAVTHQLGLNCLCASALTAMACKPLGIMAAEPAMWVVGYTWLTPAAMCTCLSSGVVNCHN
jgi:hypothetical protein